MELDLSARGAKWKREEQRRREQAKRKLQTERQARDAAARAQLALEAEQARRRAEKLAQQAEAEAAALDEQRVTGGVRYLEQLRVVATASDGDRVALPVAALEALDPQRALELGAFTFELSAGGAKTHAGVLEFTADEGTVGLPPKVAASLFQGLESVPETVQVKFVRLEKGRFASLQPRGRGFGARQIDFKQLLERALKAHTTLSVGDIVLVRHGKETFEVRVTELRPESAVNILNTDLEVALEPCEAAERAKEAEKQRELEAAQALERERQQEQRKADRMASLEPEPPADERFQVKVMLRLPSGTQATRRFLHEARLGSVFNLIEGLTGGQGSEFQVAATYPRRVFSVDAADKTLKELGLNGRQEALFVEAINADGSADGEPADVEMANGEEDENALSRTTLPEPWEDARRRLEQALDEVRCISLAGAT